MLQWANHSDLVIIGKIFFLLQKLSIGDAQGDDVRSGRKAKACNGRLRSAQESMG